MIDETGVMKGVYNSRMPLYFNSCLCHSVTYLTRLHSFETQEAEIAMKTCPANHSNLRENGDALPINQSQHFTESGV